jgi:hypothetical protein
LCIDTRVNELILICHSNHAGWGAPQISTAGGTGSGKGGGCVAAP